MTSDRDTIAQRKEEQEKPRTEVQIDPKILDNYVGYYHLKQNMIFTITRQGDQLFTQLTGQRPVQVYPESAQKFFAKVVHALNFVCHRSARTGDGIGSASGRHGTTRKADRRDRGTERRGPTGKENRDPSRRKHSLPRKMNWKTWAAIIACLLPLAAISTGVVAQRHLPKEENKAMTSIATLLRNAEEQEKPRTEVQIDPKILDNCNRLLPLEAEQSLRSHDRSDLCCTQLTGQRPVQVYPESAQKFFREGRPLEFRSSPIAGTGDGIGSASGRHGTTRKADLTKTEHGA